MGSTGRASFKMYQGASRAPCVYKTKPRSYFVLILHILYYYAEKGQT